jgi:CubicO group peptidase (beta-lactamase class C family)
LPRAGEARPDHAPRRAFGHIGMTNIFSWADPDRRLAVELLTSGKPTLTPEAVRVLQRVRCISEAFPPL